MSQRRTSIEGRLALLLGSLLVIAVAVAILVDYAIGNATISILVSLLLTLPLTLWLLHLQLAPLTRLLQALSDGVACLKDGDFSFSLAQERDDELGDLVEQYNQVVAVLRDERQAIFQRELLLDTVIQASPLALVLVNIRGHIIFANTAAKRLFNEGRRMAGEQFMPIIDRMPDPMAEAVRREADGLFVIGEDDDQETWHLSVSRFALNGLEHSLFLFKHLTRELTRQEVATWKKVIRVISHELNNSLAPISSLAHSGQLVAEQHDDERLADILGTIEDRAQHLKVFIEGYARFAKLPSPRLEAVDWDRFLHQLESTVVFRRVGELPRSAGWMDPAQMEQVMINLVKNAHEAGGPADGVEVEVSERPDGVVITVRDRGQGMSDEVLHGALLPFYSTKQSGTGLGLPLCREIVEAHGGRLSIRSRPDGGIEVVAKLPASPGAGQPTGLGAANG
jgi:nitrogen fixation/metabolism regulation signal transduction histidine kinase